MRIAFIDFIDWDYQIETVYQRPMGGSQSAVCYLAEQLAKRGLEVFLVNYTKTAKVSRGVTCLPIRSDEARTLMPTVDVLVVASNPDLGARVQPFLRPHTPMVLWTQHAHDQESVTDLHNPIIRDSYRRFALVSDWQKQQYCEQFSIDAQRVRVTRNAIPPVFEGIFPKNSSILAAKSKPPVLVYTSTPFRGLDVLLEAFPSIRNAIPGTRLQVFSSMKVYQVDRTLDESRYGGLYRLCQETEGVEYVGSVPQPQLKDYLKAASVLAYPNTFAETSCISVMEALASGCRVVTSALAALPETMAGFGESIEIPNACQESLRYAFASPGDREVYIREFIDRTVAVLRDFDDEVALRRQVDWVNRHYTWENRADEWERWLREIVGESAIELSQLSAGEEGLTWQAYQCLVREQYDRAGILYERAISQRPDISEFYWYLGLTQLLRGDADDAEATWLSGMMSGEETEQLTAELAAVLEAEAQRQEAIAQHRSALTVRSAIAELRPDDGENWLRLAIVLAKLGEFDEEVFQTCLEYLKTESIDEDLRQPLFESLWTLDLTNSTVWALFETCVVTASLDSYVRQEFCDRSAPILQQDAALKSILVSFSVLWLKLQPENLPILVKLINLYQDTQQYAEAAQLARKFYDRAETLPKQIAAYYLLLRGLLRGGGEFENAKQLHQKLEAKLNQLIDSNPEIELPDLVQSFATTSFLPYLEDNPKKLHDLRFRLSNFLQSQLYEHFGEPIVSEKSNSLKRIGYISSCFRRNSVGHLVRWLLKYHNKEKYKIIAYSLHKAKDEIQDEISTSVSEFRDISNLSVSEIAEIIRNDNIDILIDLDSLTCTQATAVLALKPAPVQVTWLGFDASELPAIDYFLVDSRVVPDHAESDYFTKLWRLPETFIAVDGFEVGVPTLRREDIDIPPDAVVYFSSQTGAKRNPENARLQLRILKQVPNSYFIIKGLYVDRDALRQWFSRLAEEEGVECDRLRFLPNDPTEAIHRANLTLADVVLDTYPYNGATTTLETLWMGIPLVTRVGEQFASRHSFDFLQLVGVTEGIAFSDEEYVEWGVRLGTDAALRQDVAWKLQQSRHSSRLWNAEVFAREVEAAFEAMLG
ncbi:O-linked N-acetylglucosamine transferase family protein [Baaleninema simplex]|uniref:O-linked N-acetylglucosamine transferase family protein n=1 Tax=Baaleninema simplex TaxID=2862350 RepID=UPI00034D81C5|nr:glycosyltransferase [Baaleninema simplex]